MKKLLLMAIAIGSVAAACAPPTTINITPSGGGGDGGDGGDFIPTGDAGAGGAPTTDTPTPTKETAYDYYVKTLYPSIIASCGGCHNPDGQVGAPAFLDYDVAVSYGLTKEYPNILKQPSESILITKPPHTGPALSEGQKEMAGKWLLMELDEANMGGMTTSSSSGGGTTSSGVSLQEMLEGFAKCMDFTLWEAKGMGKIALQQTNGDGQCASCHNQCAGGLCLSPDSLETFEKNKQYPYILRLVTPVYEGSTPVDLAQSNRIINKGIEPCANPPICHPKYTLSAANKAAFEDFVGATLTKWEAGICP